MLVMPHGLPCKSHTGLGLGLELAYRWNFTDNRYADIDQPIWEHLPICHIGRYIGTSATTDTDISVLPILAISADILYRPIPICQPYLGRDLTGQPWA